MTRWLIAFLLMVGTASVQTAVPDPTISIGRIVSRDSRPHYCARAAYAIRPDPRRVRTTDASEICSHGTRELRHWDRRRDDRIMVEYGLPPGPHPNFEMDHLVPLGIGGADDERNLWPEPRRSVEPVWNAERKDRLEWKLRDLICSGQLDVREAQRAVAEDWTEAYGRFFRESATEGH